MKITLLFLAVFVAVSHQQYYNYRNYRTMFGYPWFIMPFPHQLQPDAYSNDFVSGNEDVLHPEEGGAVVGLIGPNSRHNIELFDEEEEYPDIQSRSKGVSRYKTRPYYSNNDQKARFFFNFPNNGVSSTFNNPLFKTAFFTSTITLSLNSIQSCIPFNQIIANPGACRRRRQFHHATYNDDEQFAIAPSETLKMMPTIISSSQLRNLDSLLSSSKDDAVSSDDTPTLDHLREKRFFINKNQFVVTSFSTTFVFVNATVTKTVNLLTTAAGVVLGAGPCVPLVPAGAAAAPEPNGCVTCLPPNFVVCPAPTG